MLKNSEFLYDPETGKLWRRAGCLDTRGYRNVNFMGRLIIEHRVVWFLYYGEWPERKWITLTGIAETTGL